MFCTFELSDAHLPFFVNHDSAEVVVEVEIIGSAEQGH